MPNDIGGWNRGLARSSRRLTLCLPLAAVLVWPLGTVTALHAQTQSSIAQPAAKSFSLARGPSDDADSALPDAPIPVSVPGAPGFSFGAQSPVATSSVPVRTHVTSLHDRLIDPSEIAPTLHPMDKVLMGLEGAVSPYSIVGWVGASTYEQAFDRSPKYGQTFKGFSQRLGAAAARGSSEGIFTNSVYAPLFHTDPRYYILGPGYGFVNRTVHAISRVFVTKNDAGRETFDYALILGNLTGAALTQTYYPPGNRNFEQVGTTFGTSLAGSAFGYLFDEFIVNSAEFLQLKHKVDLSHGPDSRQASGD